MCDKILSRGEFCWIIKIEDLILQRDQWKAVALRAEKRSRVAVKKQLELKEECDIWKAIAKGKQLMIFGVDVLLVGQEYWVSADAHCDLWEVADKRPGFGITYMGAIFYNGRSVIYKPELD